MRQSPGKLWGDFHHDRYQRSRHRLAARGDCLVLMMTVPGLALFYAGLVRKKNVLSTMMQSFAAAAW